MTKPEQTEARLLLIVEASPNAVVLANAAGKIVAVNAVAEQLFGYTGAELQGQLVELLLPERSRARHPGLCEDFHRDPVERPMGAGRDLHGLRKDGTEVPLEIGLTFFQAVEGAYVFASIIDITLRKRAEETLIQERNLLRTLIDNLPDYIFVKDRERRFLIANTATAQLMGRERPDELLGKKDEDFYPAKLGEEFQADEEKVFAGEPIINKDEPHVDQQGCRREILTTKIPLHDNAGKIVGLVGISRDITELKQKELALQSALAEQERLVADLQAALNHVKTLQGLLPICGFCHKIRNSEGNWERLETFISSRTDADFTHSFCPDCGNKYYAAFLPPKP
jgi:PAS domain S-box-containing protein